ncbi:hypothetical protein GCM10027046_29700 [Uliginosibacterium flavum]|uniref:LPS export ABC transporter periplasmic protein LptC n=1 Tax=Uliginosibacterium flavum TaxID=1396831 RepID=A0ABV2TIK0_9RHOO
MKIAITCAALCLLSASASAELDSTAPNRIKVGDKINLTVQRYEQESPSEPSILQEKKSSASYSIDSDTGEERSVKYSNGAIEVFNKKLAFIASVSKNGERKDLKPSAIKNWMPTSDLKAGMKWTFETLWEAEASNAARHMCQFDGGYKARSSDSERDLTIDGKLVHLNVTVVDIEGNISLRTCEGDAWRVQERYVYSKDLDLIIEHNILQKDPFGKMLGGASNRLLKVSAITTNPVR